MGTWRQGISRRYRTLLCQLFGVSAEQLGFAPIAVAAPSRPVHDAESLVSMLDDAARLLDKVGAGGRALAPHLLSAWNDTVTSRRSMLGLLDPAATDPAGHARAVTANITDLEQLAQRYVTLFTDADPAALLIPLAAHVRMAAAAPAREAGDHHTGATVLGYAAQLAHAEGMTSAAAGHLAAALTHAERAPTLQMDQPREWRTEP